MLNLNGQFVSLIANRNFTTGLHRVVWQGDSDCGVSVTSGLYFVKLTSSQASTSQTLTLVK